MLFKKPNLYRKITIRIYPSDDNYDCSIDFDKKKSTEKYHNLCEKYKKLSLESQANLIERSKDIFKITIFIESFTFTIYSELVLPNIEFMKALAQMDNEQLALIEGHYTTITDMSYPDIFLFEDYVREAYKLKSNDLQKLEKDYKIVVRLHNSYSKLHIESIFNIIQAFVGDNYVQENDVIFIKSSDMKLRKTMTDLAMSKYFDIEIEE